MKSEIKNLGSVKFPVFSNLRIMMMPFLLENISTVIDPYKSIVKSIIDRSSCKNGIGYLTIDECDIPAGESHRRPGKHVDGCGAWGGGGAPWAQNGMFVAASEVGCRAWNQHFDGFPGIDGDCEHLSDQCKQEIIMQPNILYWCNSTAVHESIKFENPIRRQWVRVSMPSDAPWFIGYTESPFGILPNGKIMPRRSGMDYRP
jgi:hypothetical protein